jgi:hypothetical protein
MEQFINYYKDINIFEYKIFTIVRNPYDKFYSLYNHIKNANKNNIFTYIINVNNLNINEWINKIKYFIENELNNNSYFDDIIIFREISIFFKKISIFRKKFPFL